MTLHALPSLLQQAVTLDTVMMAIYAFMHVNNIRIDDQLLAEAKQLAARRGSTWSAIIEDALRETLVRQEALREGPPIQLTTVERNQQNRVHIVPEVRHWSTFVQLGQAANVQGNLVPDACLKGVSSFSALHSVIRVLPML